MQLVKMFLEFSYRPTLQSNLLKKQQTTNKNKNLPLVSWSPEPKSRLHFPPCFVSLTFFSIIYHGFLPQRGQLQQFPRLPTHEFYGIRCLVTAHSSLALLTSPLLPGSLVKATIILWRVGQKEEVGRDGEGKEPGREGSEHHHSSAQGSQSYLNKDG